MAPSAGPCRRRSRCHSGAPRRWARGVRPLDAAGLPLALHAYAAPVSNDPLALEFKQPIDATEPLRTGAYGKTLVFTLSTASP